MPENKDRSLINMKIVAQHADEFVVGGYILVEGNNGARILFSGTDLVRDFYTESEATENINAESANRDQERSFRHKIDVLGLRIPPKQHVKRLAVRERIYVADQKGMRRPLSGTDLVNHFYHASEVTEMQSGDSAVWQEERAFRRRIDVLGLRIPPPRRMK